MRGLPVRRQAVDCTDWMMGYPPFVSLIETPLERTSSPYPQFVVSLRYRAF
ncbi:hypothetical protein IG631_12414 [Alternaria alternata]|nr:hypothetical protein IG631_12414 [Alternaria alternata]